MKPSTYKKYVLGVLMVVLAFNYVDRYALGLAQENIKADLHLSDTQLGLLSGIAFALFYSVVGIPIARWADRGNRVTIIGLTTALWSAMVAICGLATSFVQLMSIRVGVGVGEAGCIPPAHSLIADLFTRAERPRAVSIYLQGGSLSVVLGYFLAGWLNELYGWRAMFILIGLPGLAMALLTRTTLQEPRLYRSTNIGIGTRETIASNLSSSAGTSTSEQPSLKEVCRTLWANKTFRHLLWGHSLLAFFNYGINNWQPAFFIRSFGLRTGELGNWLTLAWGASTLVGIYLGGEWASRHATNNETLQLRTMAIVNVAFSGGLWALIYLAHSYHVAFALMSIANLGGTMIYGPLFATFQTLVSPRMRAISIAIVYLFANLIGLGLGPLAVGALSDALRPLLAEESLRYALLAVCPGYLWVSWHLWQASKTVTGDLASIPTDRDDVAEGALRSEKRIMTAQTVTRVRS